MAMKVVAIKMNADQLAQVDEVASILQKEPQYQLLLRAGKITRGTAVRILLKEALDARKATQQTTLGF